MTVLPIALFSQNFWTKVDERTVKFDLRDERTIKPEIFTAYDLDIESFTTYIQSAPKEDFSAFRQPTLSLYLPGTDGKLEEFYIWDSPIMEEGLMSKYPGIKSYKGYMKKNPGVVTRFDISIYGIRGSIRKYNDIYYIDPIGSTKSTYMLYHTADTKDNSFEGMPLCGTDEHNFVSERSIPKGTRSFQKEKRELRTYRLALACTGEWGAVRGTKEKALADMVALVNRSNMIFEPELAIRMILIEETDRVIFLDGLSDPYTESNRGLSILGQNTAILNQNIGATRYEIGHVLSICNDVGGVAGGNICTTARGAGVTCYNSSSLSTGTVYVFTHEVGHQMTAAHTFNNCPGNEGQTSGAGYEPGSGSTIMAYPGACGTSNLGVAREGYFHNANLEQMLSFTDIEGAFAYNCATKIQINNHLPVIDWPYTNGFHIPILTPFGLKAYANDIDGDTLRYNWEQFDNQGSHPLGSPQGNAPIFRSVRPNSSSLRSLPNAQRTLTGNMTDVQELMPTYSRDLTFRFTVRDNNYLGGGTVWEELKFKVDGDSGPFVVTAPNEQSRWTFGEKVNIKWDVANTDQPPVNCKFVDIYLSINGNLDFDSDLVIPILKRVPNSGEALVVIPPVVYNNVRVIVKASDNIFYAITNPISRVIASTTPGFYMSVENNLATSCIPDPVSFSFNTLGYNDFNGNVTFEIINELPTGLVATFEKSEVLAGQKAVLNLDLSDFQGDNQVEILVRSYVAGMDTIDRWVYLITYGTDIDFVEKIEPENGLTNATQAPKYEWNTKTDAKFYQLQVSKSILFDEENIILNETLTDTKFITTDFLDVSTIYFWRVRAVNDCRLGAWSEVGAFNTELLDCYVETSGALSIPITASGTPTVYGEITVFKVGKVNELNVKKIRAEHNFVGDLTATLIGPSGRRVVLWDRRCASSKNLNITFSDKSPNAFICPLNNGRVLRPVNPLSAFNGEDVLGTWTLELKDNTLGNGGRLQEVVLEFCSNIEIVQPTFLHKKVLEVSYNDSKIIDNDLLEVNSMQAGASQLVYNIVTLPKLGVITKNNVPLVIGSTFTQEDINNALVQYVHTSAVFGEDFFEFYLIDGNGGWLPITKLDIIVDKNTSLQPIPLENLLLSYPNPTSDQLVVNLLQDNAKISEISLYTASGQPLIIQKVESNFWSHSMTDIPQGVYMLRVRIGTKWITRKVIKI